MKKYELTENTIVQDGVTLYQIRALRDFGRVKIGDLGGYVAEDGLLPHEGTVWAYEGTKILPGAEINPMASIKARVYIGIDVTIYRNVIIGENTHIDNFTAINPNVRIGDNVNIGENTIIETGTRIQDNVNIDKEVMVSSHSKILSGVHIKCGVQIFSKTSIGHNTVIGERTRICMGVQIDDNVVIGRNVYIGNRVHIEAGSYIGDIVGLAKYTHIGPNAHIVNSSDYISISGSIEGHIGQTNIYKTKYGICVTQDLGLRTKLIFEGTFIDFKNNIIAKYGDKDTDSAREQLLLIDFIQYKFDTV